MPVIMGTAGHIDHGKTSLVKALTGINCDRLKEERNRGITIELGFAHLELPGGERLGVVDVPGHERFVRNMVSGAAGMDFVLLVIAADEGVMPQTREHVEICALLGLRRGLVALTKVDMVDEELLALAEEDVRTFLEGTFLEGADIVPVSAASGQGIDELRQKIAHMAAQDAPQRRADLFRLPVDRVFTIKGHGTVVTGTLLSGSPRVGEEVEIMPEARASRIRGLQNHGQSEEAALPGQRLSLNLAGLDVEEVHRGDVVAWPGTLEPSRRWLTTLTCLSSAPRALRQRTEVHFHHGTREVAARLYFYHADRLNPGETALAEVHFAEPMVGVFNDRFVVRAYSPLRTVAGGQVLSPLNPQGMARKRKLFTPELCQELLALPDRSEADVLLAQLALRPVLTQRQLALCSNLDEKRLEKALNQLSGQGQAACFDKEGRVWVSAAGLAALQEEFLTRAETFHKKEPLKPGMAKGVLLAAGPSPKLSHFALEKLLRAGRLEAEGDVVRLAGHRVSLASDQSRLKEELLKAHADLGLSPPNLKDVLEGLEVSQKEADPVLKILQTEKSLIKVKEGLYFHGPALNGLLEKVRNWFSGHDDLDPSSFKELSGGLSRKYIIPLLEYMDKERLTIRVGDKRQWRK